MVTASSLTYRYLDENPVVVHCMKEGIANLSKIARRIAEESSIENTSAVLMALRRYRIKDSPLEMLKSSKKTITIEGGTAEMKISMSEKQLPHVMKLLN